MAAFPFFSTRNPVRAKNEARQPSSQSPAAIAAEPAAEARTAHLHRQPQPSTGVMQNYALQSPRAADKIIPVVASLPAAKAPPEPLPKHRLESFPGKCLRIVKG